jgi:hypothetical protein
MLLYLLVEICKSEEIQFHDNTSEFKTYRLTYKLLQYNYSHALRHVAAPKWYGVANLNVQL